MTRITPRTCLWPITFTLIATFALSIGLTFQSDHHCFAGVCGEVLFPLQARLHVVVWYLWVTISVTALGFRAFHPQLRRYLRHPLFERKLPLLGKHFAVSGLLIIIWVAILYGVVVGVWWLRLRDYFNERGNGSGVTSGNDKLAAIALTGHFADITMGMVLLPISRHSALASFFKLSVSTALAFHMVTAYILFAIVLIHTLLYVSWIPVFHSLSSSLRQAYPVLNPTYYYDQVWPGSHGSLEIWRASLVFTGLVTLFIMSIIAITTLPAIRRNHFNTFYFTHLTVIIAVIVVCLHASTMFYCTSPGIVLWIVDWSLRLYELRRQVEGKVTTIGNGYYILAMPLPRKRLDGCACTSPLAHFYIYHSDSSIRELHPFTTITHLASENARAPKDEDDFIIQFLFRKRSRAVPAEDFELVSPNRNLFDTLRTLLSPKKKKKGQWTEKLASLADSRYSPNSSDSPKPDVYTLKSMKPASDTEEKAVAPTFAFGPDHTFPVISVNLRLEGPYFTPADPSTYRTVVCLVAGTGISGGIAIAGAFAETERQRAISSTDCSSVGATCVTTNATSIWERCVIIWSVREADYIDMPFFKGLASEKLEFRPQLTGNGRARMDFDKTIEDVKASGPEGPIWVYLSGPNLFITTGEMACKKAGVDWYGARWDI